MQSNEVKDPEAQIALSSADLISKIIQQARAAGTGDPDTERLLANPQNCRVIITAVGTQLHVDARMNQNDSEYRIWAGAFCEEAMH